jgi:hypothetical protein
VTALENPVRSRFIGATTTPTTARLTYANSVSSQESGYGAIELDRYYRVFQDNYPQGSAYWKDVLAALYGRPPAQYLKVRSVRNAQLTAGTSVWLSNNAIELDRAESGWAVVAADLPADVEDDFGVPLKFRVGSRKIHASVRVELSASSMEALRVQPQIPRLRIGPDEEL